MKKRFLLIVTLVTGMCFSGLNAQVNYAEGWDANGATGSGSEPTSWGWVRMHDPSAVWSEANATSGRRYMDPGNGQHENYTFDGEPFDGRILWIRFQYDTGTGDEHRFNFGGLEAGKTYKVSLKYAWHNNGYNPALVVGVYAEGDFYVYDESFELTEKRTLYLFETDFEAEADFATENYYLSFKSNNYDDCMITIADIQVTEVTGSSISTADVEEKSYEIINVKGGLEVATVNGCSNELLNIYSITGRLIQSVDATAEPTFVALAQGVYIVNNKKVIVK